MPERLGRSRLSWWLRVPVGYTLLFAWLVQPLARDAGSALPFRPNFCDAQFITWVLSWVHRALVTGAGRLFDANIGYPAPGQLTGSEHFLSVQLAFTPLLWLTDNPVLATNLVAFLSYPAAAVAMERLLAALGFGGAAAWLAGFVFALGPLRVPFNVHVVQYLNLYLPLAALALVRLRDRPGARRAAWLAVILAAGGSSSYYLALLLGIVAAVWAACELLRPAPGRRRFLLLAATAAVAAVAALALFSRPYFERPTAQAGPEVLIADGWWPGFADTPWGLAGYPPRYQWLVAGLGVLALLARVPGTARAIVPALVLVPVGTLLMYGFPPALAHVVVDSPLGFVQWPHRFAVLAGFGDALLVASTLQAVAWWAGHWAGWLATAAFASAVLVAPARSLGRAVMIDVAALGADRPVYEAIARIARPRGGGALLELPLARGRWERHNCKTTEPDSMVGSTIHWLPLVGGYSGYQPPHRGLLLRTTRALPAAWALDDLIDMTHVRWLLIRPASNWASEPQWGAIVRGLTASPSLGPPIDVGVPGWTLLPVVRQPMHPQWFDAIRSGWRRGTTVLGTPLVALSSAAAAGSLDAVQLPNVAPAGRAFWLTVRVENRGNADWPAVPAPPRPMILNIGIERDVPEAYRVALFFRWRSLQTDESTDPQIHWLRRDLPAGEALVQPVLLTAPPASGMYELEVRLRQVGGPELHGPGAAAMRLTVWIAEPPPAAP